MKRYYISKIIGDGTEGNSYRVKIADSGKNYVAVIANDPVTGAPTRQWALVLVAAADHTDLLADTDNNAFPDITLDAIISTIPLATRNAVKNFLLSRGIDISDLKNSDPFRLIIRRVGKFIHNAFDENNFDVIDQ